MDIAKETADIILMKKDLMVLEQGVLEGRKTFGNIVKYIKMAASGNFGNMISVIFASLFLPFLPLLPVQILAQNLICDFAQMGLPFDRVDAAYIRRPHRWDTGGHPPLHARHGAGLLPLRHPVLSGAVALLWGG